MKALPHDPPREVFETLRRVLDQEIAATDSTRRDGAIAEEDGPALMTFGDNLIVRGMIGYLFDEPLPRVAQIIRDGLACKREAVEAGKFLSAWLLWDYLLYSLAVGDIESADYFATIPQNRWWNRKVKPITWYVNRSRALVALYSGRDEEAGRLLETVRVQVFEEELPLEVRADKSDIQCSVVILRALHERDTVMFQTSLESRQRWRAERYRILERVAPKSLIDLDGLGLCRMALDRSMSYQIESPYLPAQMLAAK